MPNQSQQSEQSRPSVRLIREKRLDEVWGDDVLIAPLRSTWNDFGFVLRAEVGFRTANSSREWVGAFFAFKGEDSLRNFVEERLTDLRPSMLIEEIGVPFASLLIESKAYSLVRRAIGAEAGRRALLAIHDVSLLNSEDEEVPAWPNFFTSPVFTHAMTRSSEGHFAYRHGALVLAGRRTSGVDARQRFSVDLTRYGPKLRFDFRFDEANALRGRVAVLIGKNGCGKTSSLSRLASGFAADKRQGVKFDARPEVNQVLVFAHSGALGLFKQRRDRSGAASLRALGSLSKGSQVTKVILIAKFGMAATKLLPGRPNGPDKEELVPGQQDDGIRRSPTGVWSACPFHEAS